jgi:hypothetical protein
MDGDKGGKKNVAPRSDALLQGIEVGDRVVVKIEGGRVVSIKRIGKAEWKSFVTNYIRSTYAG